MKMDNPYFCDLCGKHIVDGDGMTLVMIRFPSFPDDEFHYHQQCAKEATAPLVNQARLVRTHYITGHQN